MRGWSSAPISWAAVGVWGVFAGILLGALLYVSAFGSPLPFNDEWVFVPYLVGDEPIAWQWLWDQHSEHRIPLPKMLLIGLTRATRCDFRAGMVYNVLAVGALAAALIVAARKLRGSTSLADAFFPLVLFQWGGSDSFMVWGFVEQLVTSSVLAGLLLALIVGNPVELTRRSAILAGTCVVLLTLCGVNGVVLIPALALWLSYAAVRQWSSTIPSVRQASRLMLMFAGLAIVMIPLTFVNVHRDTFARSSSVWDTLRTSLEFASMSLGMEAYILWPWSGRGVFAFLILTFSVLLIHAWRRPDDRFRALGLLAFMAACASLALAIGWGRGSLGWRAGFQQRYMIAAAPMLCAAFLIWGLNGGRSGRLVQWALLGCVILLFPGNLQRGLKDARYHRQEMNTLSQDLAAGLPPFAIVLRNADTMVPESIPERQEILAEALKKLQAAGIKPYNDLPRDPAVQELILPVPHVGRDTASSGSGSRSSLTVPLGEPQRVYALRLTYHENGAADVPKTLQVTWKRGDDREFPPASPAGRLTLKPLDDNERQARTVAVWVNETIDHLRIEWDDERVPFHPTEIALYVAAEDPHTANFSGGRTDRVTNRGTRLPGWWQ
jgi:hypothetical protein